MSQPSAGESLIPGLMIDMEDVSRSSREILWSYKKGSSRIIE